MSEHRREFETYLFPFGWHAQRGLLVQWALGLSEVHLLEFFLRGATDSKLLGVVSKTLFINTIVFLQSVI